MLPQVCFLVSQERGEPLYFHSSWTEPLRLQPGRAVTTFSLPIILQKANCSVTLEQGVRGRGVGRHEITASVLEAASCQLDRCSPLQTRWLKKMWGGRTSHPPGSRRSR